MINLQIPTGFNTMSAGTKVGVHFGLYIKTLLSLGTEKHEKWTKRAFKMKDYGCFALTEMGHGSNVQGLLTTATYDHSSRSFILNTPVDEGMKFWIGNLAQTANMAIVFAQLLINGKNEGVHGFLIKIRDDDGNVMPGILIGDCGTKMGNNGVDNGWCLFRSMRVPVDALLNRFSTIDETGKFKSKIKSKSKRFAVQISALSGGRLGVAVTACLAIVSGCGIALRYCTVRKQFGERKGMENTLMDYPLVHTKLLTRMSFASVLNHAGVLLDNEWENVNVFDLGDIQVKELHALSSFIKVSASWNMKAGLAKARELVGGHGYSAYSYIGTLMNDTEVHVTWEGTNEVLLQQTCKNLMDEFNLFRNKGEIRYKTLAFLKQFEDGAVDLDPIIEQIKEISEELLIGSLSNLVKSPEKESDKLTFAQAQEVITMLNKLNQAFEKILQLRVYEMVDKCLAKFGLFLTQVKSTQNNMFKSFNSTLPHVLFPAATFYGELFCFSALMHNLRALGPDDVTPFLFKETPFFGNLSLEKYYNEKLYFIKCLVIYACNTLTSSVKFYADANENLDYEFFDSLSNIVLKLTESMRYDALTFSDIAHPRHISPGSIGDFDGDVYNSIKREIFSRKSNFGKSPSWDLIRKLKEES
jgi:alkylation response protein AidB-like acyl-CoA dehydrogenase